MQALGLIETRGLLPAIACADVMLKTAQVELVGRTFVGGGLVTIIVTGDVGAVKAAVEAGITVVEQIGQLALVSQHVIPRPHSDIESMILVKENHAGEENSLPNQDVGAEPMESIRPIQEHKNIEEVTLTDLHKAGIDALIQQVGLEQSVPVLEALSVVKLRNLAREYKELGVAGRAISKANKELLLQKLMAYYAKESER
jgi:ethanolamine utilization protein EutM